MATNPELAFTLDDAVGEVLGLLTGLDLTYAPEEDRYRAITRQLNRALRANALENEWAHYHSTTSLGAATAGVQEVHLPSSLRPRIIGDDAVRLVDSDGVARVWAYYLPRDALGKYSQRIGLWCSVLKSSIMFNRPFTTGEAELEVMVPVQREPYMFRLPPTPEDPAEPPIAVPTDIRNQEIDFNYPDLITTRAAFFYAQTDPVMQPRAQTLQDEAKDLMYQVIERDNNFTDSPYENPYTIPVQGNLGVGEWQYGPAHPHPSSNTR